MLPRLHPHRLGQRQQEIEHRLGKHRYPQQEAAGKKGQRRLLAADRPLEREDDPFGAAGRHQAGAEDRCHGDQDADIKGRAAKPLCHPAADRFG